MFNYKLYEVNEDISFFAVPENEAVCLEHLFDEPGYKEDLIEDLLDLDTFEIQKYFNIEDMSGTLFNDQMHIDSCSDAVRPNLPGEQGKSAEFLHEMLQGVDNGFLQVDNALASSDDIFVDAKHADKALSLDQGACKDPFVGNVELGSIFPGISKRDSGFSDAKHADTVFSVDHVACGDPLLGNVGSISKSPGVNKKNSNDEITDLHSTSFPVDKCMEDHESSLLNCHHANEEQHNISKSLYGNDTVGKDRQWFKQHEFFNSENHVAKESCLNHLACSVNSTKHEINAMPLTCTEDPKNATSFVAGTLISVTMTGDGQMKRKRLAGGDSCKTSNYGVSKVDLASVNEGDKSGSCFVPKRTRKAPKRYIEESLKYDSKCHSRKFRASCRKSKDGFHHGNSQKCQDDSFDGGCIQVPFGLPIEKEHPEEVQTLVVYENWKYSRLLPSKEQDIEPYSPYSEEDATKGWQVTRSPTVYENWKYSKLLSSKEQDIEPYSPYSEEDASKGWQVTRSPTDDDSSRKKRHISWTLSEVVKLVDGVAQYGVGRWTEIKKLLFSSSRRTSVDIKDKWRNLLRASSALTQMKKKVEKGRKQATQQVPESILSRVRELSAIYPYPREHRSNISCIAAPAVLSLPSTTSNLPVPLSTTV